MEPMDPNFRDQLITSQLNRRILRRLAPFGLVTVLWFVTGHVAVMIGGAALATIVQVGWALLRPVREVVYEEIMAHRTEVQVRRRNELLKTFLPFLQAYKTVLTTYPPALLTASAPEVAAQLDTFAETVRQVKARRFPEYEDPGEPQCEDPYELVQTTSLSPRDFRHWRLRDCQTWRQDLLAVLAQGRITALRHAVHHVAHERPRSVWEPCLADAAGALEREAEQRLCHWRCIQRAHTAPAVRQHLTTLLRLDSINRQTGLRSYLMSRDLQCPLAEVQEVMAYIRYDSVAAKVLALVEAPRLPLTRGEDRGEERGTRRRDAPAQTVSDV